MTTKALRETELYEPVKSYLMAQGYEVKGEVGSADIVAVRADEDPVIVELKTGFALTLYHQAIDRQAISDFIYIAVPRKAGWQFLKGLRHNKKLCRRLGLGLITVRMSDGFVEVHQDPAPYKPRQSKTRKGRLLKEFAKRVGDPNTGGVPRQTLVTAYRQDALRCLSILSDNGATKASNVAQASGVARARDIMAHDHYGWFDRVEIGIYALSPKGEDAVSVYATELKNLKNPGDGT